MYIAQCPNRLTSTDYTQVGIKYQRHNKTESSMISENVSQADFAYCWR